MAYFERLEQELSSLPDVSTHPHRFGGREFRFKQDHKSPPLEL
jgi:hypothetical protein